MCFPLYRIPSLRNRLGRCPVYCKTCVICLHGLSSMYRTGTVLLSFLRVNYILHPKKYGILYHEPHYFKYYIQHLIFEWTSSQLSITNYIFKNRNLVPEFVNSRPISKNTRLWSTPKTNGRENSIYNNQLK